ncbi:MAG: Ni/Fe-hydrogenase cytochrome b subunit, partial [Myxococcales bacterium]
SFFFYLAVRLGGLALNGFEGFGMNSMSVLFVAEIALFAAPAVLLLDAKKRANPGWIFFCAVLALFAGGMYRFDTYLVAFDPGPGWHYFPSIPEMMVTIGFVALEMAAFVFIVKTFPILHAKRSEA